MSTFKQGHLCIVAEKGMCSFYDNSRGNRHGFVFQVTLATAKHELKDVLGAEALHSVAFRPDARIIVEYVDRFLFNVEFTNGTNPKYVQRFNREDFLRLVNFLRNI